jgi:lipopolysaccharide biosynthesis glycosyltransferase
MPLATTLRSIFEANPNSCPLDFHIFSDGILEATRKKILESLPINSASIQWHEVDLSPFQKFSTIAYISKITYARFLIPNIFPDTVQKVLYLDADILVLDNLTALWETDLEGNVVAAVLDGMDTQFKSGKTNIEGFPSVRNYFNAGVLLIDLTRWRQEHISELAMEYLTRHPKSPYSDQDALNVACDGLWKKLDSRWNFHDHHYEKMIADMTTAEKPGIVHFVTSLKPWKPNSFSVNADYYDSFRSRTCFARSPLDKSWDIAQGYWSQLKGMLKQYPFLRAFWSQLLSGKPIK